jgi:hypothetical protein
LSPLARRRAGHRECARVNAVRPAPVPNNSPHRDAMRASLARRDVAIAPSRRRRRASSRRATDADGFWIPGPFLRPEGSPASESCTGPTVWRLMQTELAESGLEQIAPSRARAMATERGWTLLDVRPRSDYRERHCWGAANAQYYRAMDARAPENWGKAALSAMMFPERVGKGYLNVTENENFMEEVLEAVEWGSKLIVYDDAGGVIGEPGVNFENGVQTPSLMAIYELAARGWGTENLLHMAGGLVYWDEVDRFDCGEIDASALEEEARADGASEGW